MKQKSSSFDRVKSILMQEVDWTHIGFSKSNSNTLYKLYQSWAERYDEEMPEIEYNYTEPMKASFLKSNIKTDSKILDAACGTGYPTMALHEMGYTNFAWYRFFFRDDKRSKKEKYIQESSSSRFN